MLKPAEHSNYVQNPDVILPRIWNHIQASIKSIESIQLSTKKIKPLLLHYMFMTCMNFSLHEIKWI